MRTMNRKGRTNLFNFDIAQKRSRARQGPARCAIAKCVGNISGDTRRILGPPGATVSSLFRQVVQKEAEGSELTRSEMKKLIARRTNDCPKSLWDSACGALTKVGTSERREMF